MKKQLGFTLIELLVVVSLIAAISPFVLTPNYVDKVNEDRSAVTVAETNMILGAAMDYYATAAAWPGGPACALAISDLLTAQHLGSVDSTNPFDSSITTTCTLTLFTVVQETAPNWGGYVANKIRATLVSNAATGEITTAINVPGSEPAISQLLDLAGTRKMKGSIDMDGNSINNVDTINANTGNIGTVNSTTVNANTGNIDTLNSITVNANTGNITNVNSNRVTATTGNITNVNSNTVTSTTGNITNVNSNRVTATTGNITNVNSNTVTATTSVTAPLGSFNTLSTNNFNTTNLTATNGTITNLNSSNGTINTLNSTTGTIRTLNSTVGNIANINANSVRATSLISAPRYLDSNNASYYLDPSATSVLFRPQSPRAPTAANDLANKAYVDSKAGVTASVVSSAASACTATTSTATANCPVGSARMGGGYTYVGACNIGGCDPKYRFVSQSYPVGARSWRAQGWCARVRAYVVCGS